MSELCWKTRGVFGLLIRAASRRVAGSAVELRDGQMAYRVQGGETRCDRTTAPQNLFGKPFYTLGNVAATKMGLQVDVEEEIF